MASNSYNGQGICQDGETTIKGGGAQITLGPVNNIIVGNNSTMYVTCKSSSKSKKKSSQTQKDIPSQYPITTSLQPLTMDQKLSIKDKVGKHWRDLARRLDLTDPELEQLEMENRSYSEVIYQIITRWEQRAAGEATQQYLATVFHKMGRGDLVDLFSDLGI